MTDDQGQGSALPTDYFQRPSPARFWNYLQGGKDNYALDREAADAYAAGYPDIFLLAKHTRRFLARAMRYLATDAGIRQFLDIGCGLPVPPPLKDVHEIVQDIHPDARVVYVDSDKVVFTRTRALLTPISPQGVCDYIDADVRDPAHVLAAAARTLDFTEPIALLLSGVLGHVPDDDEARQIVHTLMRAVPAGSFLVLTDGFDDGRGVIEGVARRNDTGIAPYRLRTTHQIRDYFTGLDLIEPGLVPVTEWRPELEVVGQRVLAQYAGVARKPSQPSGPRSPRSR